MCLLIYYYYELTIIVSWEGLCARGGDAGGNALVWGRDLMLILNLCDTWSSLKNVMQETTALCW